VGVTANAVIRRILIVLLIALAISAALFFIPALWVR
jgi:hypothetical protein